MVRIEDLQIREQRLISPRLAGLTLQRTDLALDLFDDVTDAQKIRFRRFEFAQRFALLRFVFCNSGRFFKNGAAIFRTRAEDQIDLALLHHRIGAARHAGIGKKILNVAQPAQCLVEKIFGIAVAINAARHAHVVPVDSELSRAIGEGERDFGKAERLARVGSVENDVGHFAAAKRFGGLFAEHPAHRIEQIGFAAAIRADDCGNAFVEIEKRLIGKRFKAEKLKRFEMHDVADNVGFAGEYSQ